MKRITVSLFFILIISIVGFFYYQAGTLPVNKEDRTSKIFVINPGESLNKIANDLADQNLIRNRVVFYLAVRQLGIEKKIQAGDFRLSPSMDSYEIAKILTHGTLDVWLTIIEGTRREEVAQDVSRNLDIPEIEFLKYTHEGYLFPDTYLIPKDATAVAVIKILDNNFDQKVTSDLISKAKKNNLTEDQLITLASLVEREAKFAQDKKNVASVLLKRLNNNILLQIDATVQYALGYQPDEKTWWKKNLTQDDLGVNSPYNTYKNLGLPPGPIANPGLASIDAVVNADPNTPYLFYISDSSGHLHFARTLEEQNENISKYLK